MHLSSRWGYKPYLPLSRHKELEAPFIVRLAPSQTGVRLEWLDKQSGPYTIEVQPVRIDTENGQTLVCEAGSPISATAEGHTAEVHGLQPGRDYKVTVSRKGAAGRFRLFRTGEYFRRKIME
mgnify:CR=1 FL=1